MFKSVWLLTKLQICNLFGLNEAKYAKDKKTKNRLKTTLVAFIILGAALVLYSALLSSAFASFGFVEIVPIYLGSLAFSIIFGFSVFRAGAIFRPEQLRLTDSSGKVYRAQFAITGF